MRFGRIDCAVSKDLSRFSRNYIDAGNYLEKIFPEMGIRYIAINNNYDSMAPGSSTDVITFPFKNLVNDMYTKIFLPKSNLRFIRKQGAVNTLAHSIPTATCGILTISID